MLKTRILYQLFGTLVVMSFLQVAWAAGGSAWSRNSHITDVRVESDVAYIMVSGDLDNFTSTSGHTCTVQKDGKEYAIKISRTGPMANGRSGGAESIIALLQAANKTHLPVDFWLSSPVGTQSGTGIIIDTCSGVDTDLPTIERIVL